ncbi:MAG: PHP-associated domain-containing protein [Candidatus Hodarchaeota archaeon]
MRLDLHIHSYYSLDSRLDPRNIIRKAKALSLDGVAITDHNSIEGSKKAIDYAKEIEDFIVLHGIEVSSSRGHILGYGVRKSIPRDLSPHETVEHIVAQGGVAVAAHPYRFWSGLGEKLTLNTNFATYEVLNARTSVRGNKMANDLAIKGGKGKIGGSDGHFMDEIGGAVTLLDERIRNEDDILDALAKKKTNVEGSSRGVRATLRYVPKCVWEWIERGCRKI